MRSGAVLAVVGASATAARGAADEIVLGDVSARSWRLGERMPVECLNRTIDTGEHITEPNGELQYIPFPVCNETGRPLELIFGSETDINCTLAALPDPLFHQLEFYIHNDAPLSCRLPSLRPAQHASTDRPAYTHLQIALSGTLQLSHLHINPELNVIVHTTSAAVGAPPAAAVAARPASEPVVEGRLLAAAAYSLPPRQGGEPPRLVIGDALPLRLTARWFSERALPPSTARLGRLPAAGLGGHVHLSTVVYCLLSFGGGWAVALAYWRGVELPRRLRRYGADKMGGEVGRGGYAFPGKRD